jgi:hypothetical protein
MIMKTQITKYHHNGKYNTASTSIQASFLTNLKLIHCTEVSSYVKNVTRRVLCVLSVQPTLIHSSTAS